MILKRSGTYWLNCLAAPRAKGKMSQYEGNAAEIKCRKYILFSKNIDFD
jgi:hypothetical protein